MDVTIDLNTIPEESSLVDQGLKTQLAGIFGRMEKRVTIRAVVDLSGEKDREMASFLRAIVSVSPNSLSWSYTDRMRRTRCRN